MVSVWERPGVRGTAHHCEESSESAQDWIRALSVVVGGYDMPVRSIEDAWWGWLEAGVQRRKARPRDGLCVLYDSVCFARLAYFCPATLLQTLVAAATETL